MQYNQSRHRDRGTKDKMTIQHISHDNSTALTSYDRIVSWCRWHDGEYVSAVDCPLSLSKWNALALIEKVDRSNDQSENRAAEWWRGRERARVSDSNTQCFTVCRQLQTVLMSGVAKRKKRQQIRQPCLFFGFFTNNSSIHYSLHKRVQILFTINVFFFCGFLLWGLEINSFFLSN